MDIEVIEKLGQPIIEILLGDNPAWESEFLKSIDKLLSSWIQPVLNWVKGHITWSKSTVWKASNRDSRILEIINNALYEAEFCKKNLRTKPRPKRQ